MEQQHNNATLGYLVLAGVALVAIPGVVRVFELYVQAFRFFVHLFGA